MSNLIRLIASLLLHPKRPLPAARGRFVALTTNDPRYAVGKVCFGNIEVVESYDEISWSDILLRRIRVLGLPSRRSLATAGQKRKRTALRWLGLVASSELALRNFHHCLFSAPAPKAMWTPDELSVTIHRFHLPEFQVSFLKAETNPLRILPLLWAARTVGPIDKADGLTVFINMMDPTLIRAYHQLHPNRTLVLRFHDCLESGLPNQNIGASAIKSMVRSLLDDGVISSVESYSATDAKHLDVTYRPNGIHPQRIRDLERPYRTHLLYFKGGAKLNNSGSRLSSLAPVLNRLAVHYPQISHWIDAGTVAVRRPYTEYLRDSLLTEVVVDLVRVSEDEGFSFRIPEALFLNRKIITNRQSILQEPFYSPERVFFVGVDDLERLPEFLERDINPLPDEILKFYDATLWWTEKDPIAHPKHKETHS